MTDLLRFQSDKKSVKILLVRERDHKDEINIQFFSWFLRRDGSNQSCQIICIVILWCHTVATAQVLAEFYSWRECSPPETGITIHI